MSPEAAEPDPDTTVPPPASADADRTVPPPASVDADRTVPPPASADADRTVPPPASADADRTVPPPASAPPPSIPRTSGPPGADTTGLPPTSAAPAAATTGRTLRTSTSSGLRTVADGTSRSISGRHGGWRSSDLLGRSMGPWVADRILGEGAWGAVFAAHRDDAPETRAALKVPKLGGTSSGDHVLARFRQEVQTLEKVHARGPAPHVVGLLGADPEARPYPWLALELIEGIDLGSELKRRRKFPVGEALRLGLGVLDGLGEAHAAGAIHRDLKPENVLMTFAGEVRVADFGVARLVEGEGSGPSVTITGQQVGTPHYMSPEQIEGRSQIASDLYSFGAMLYAMIAGRPPFRGGKVAVIDSHLTRVPAPLSDFALGVPRELDELVASLLAKDAAKRPTAAEAQERLRRIVQSLGRPALEAKPKEGVALELVPNDEVGDYTIEREIGRGGMGIVYAARDSKEERVALKVAGFSFSTQEQARAQLLRDAQNAISVTRERPHPAVARVREVGEAVVRGLPIVYLVSELVPGPSLEKAIQDAGPLEERVALGLARSVADGLGAIHEAGVLHLDVTPANILLAGDFESAGSLPEKVSRAQPKIVDFGISRRAESLTVRSVEGNPLYMSPEQCGGEIPTPASDVYMLGACLYHAVTGGPPFTGEPLAVMNRHRTELPRPVELEDATLGPDLALVIHRCLLKDAKKRYANARALAKDLASVGSPELPRAELKQLWEAERRAFQPRRLPRWLVPVAALVLVALGSLLYVVAGASARRGELAKRLGDATESGLPALVDEAGLTRAPESVPDAVRDAATARAAALVAKLEADLVARSRDVQAAPEPTRGRLAELRGRWEGLAAVASRAPVWASAGTWTKELGQVEPEIAWLERACDVASALERSEWDGLERASLGLHAAATPGFARELDGELSTAARGGLAAIDGAADEACRRSRDLLAKTPPSYVEAREVLASLERETPSLRRRVRAASAVAALGREIEEGLGRNPGEVAASAERQKLEALVRSLGAGLESVAEDDVAALESARPALDRVVREREDWLARPSPDGSRKLGDTSAGLAVAQELARDRERYSRWAARALARKLEDVAPLFQTSESAATYDRIARELAAFEPGWLRCGSGETAVPGRSGEATPVREVLARERARLDAARGSAAGRLAVAAERELRAHDLASAEATCARGLEIADLASRQAPAVRRLGLARRQLAHFRELDARAVPVELAPDSLVGRHGTREGPYAERPAVLLAGRIRVDACETTVETYALFLEWQGEYANEPTVLAQVEHPEAPRRDHRPDDPPWQRQLEHPRRPVLGVSWFDAYACLRWAGRRLLEADEWEVVARGRARDEERIHDWQGGAARTGWRPGEPLDAGASGEQGDQGVLDMAGNASEWTATAAPRAGTAYFCGPNFTTLPSVELQALYLRNYAPHGARKRFLGCRGALAQESK